MTPDPQDLSTALVRDIMTTPVHRVDMDDTLLSVKQLFGRVNCHHVVVLEKKCVFGVVSDRDILKCVSPFVGNRTLERSQDVNTLKRMDHPARVSPVKVRHRSTAVIASSYPRAIMR